MFDIGQQVVCIADWPEVTLGLTHRPERGRVYTIRNFDPDGIAVWNIAYFRLEEIVNPLDAREHEPSFLSTCFRPLRKTDIAIFTEMLNKTPTPRQLLEVRAGK